MKRILIYLLCVTMILSMTGCGSKEENVVYNIEQDIRKGSVSNYATTYAIGSVLSAKCSVDESDGNGRYLLSCTIKYNPKLNNGTTDLSKSMTDEVLAVYLDNQDKTYSRKFGAKNTGETMKKDICWGQASSVGANC